jgi:hypothetical protein
MGVAITHDLSIIQMPSMPHQDEEIAERPARVGFVGRGVCETYEAIATIDFVEEALFIGLESTYGPDISKLFEWRDWCFWSLLWITPSLYAFC